MFKDLTRRTKDKWLARAVHHWREDLRGRLIEALDFLEGRAVIPKKEDHKPKPFIGMLRRAMYPGGVIKLEQLSPDGKWREIPEERIEA
jgi:hypothetical protein